MFDLGVDSAVDPKLRPIALSARVRKGVSEKFVRGAFGSD